MALLALIAAFAVSHVRAGELAWDRSGQLVLVVTHDWNASEGMLRAFSRTPQGWRADMQTTPVTLGRSGAAWGIGLHPAVSGGPVKREGDGRSPAGIFRIGEAFGYASSFTTALTYRGMTESDYCVDVSGSPLYNQIVDANAVGKAAVEGSTEPMRRDLHANGDRRYRIGFVIEHNAARKPAEGSCIFAHLWKQPGEATSGCTAMDEAVMRELLGWLRADQQPVFVLLPQSEYSRRKQAWRLP